MAEPPIRRPADRPPPIPSARGVLSPNAAKTEVHPHVADELPEDTRNLEAPDAGELVTAMLDLVATEAGALLARDDSDGKLADLNVRTALASWDALHQPDEAMRLLELAEGHPLVPRLRLSAAIGQGPDELAFAEARSDGSIALAVELAEAWLWRHGKHERAAQIADRLLEGDLPWRGHVIEQRVANSVCDRTGLPVPDTTNPFWSSKTRKLVRRGPVRKQGVNSEAVTKRGRNRTRA